MTPTPPPVTPEDAARLWFEATFARYLDWQIEIESLAEIITTRDASIRAVALEDALLKCAAITHGPVMTVINDIQCPYGKGWHDGFGAAKGEACDALHALASPPSQGGEK